LIWKKELGANSTHLSKEKSLHDKQNYIFSRNITPIRHKERGGGGRLSTHNIQNITLENTIISRE
jgi:hypothetical protein